MASTITSIFVLGVALSQHAEAQGYDNVMAKFAHAGIAHRGPAIGNNGAAFASVNQPTAVLNTLTKLKDENQEMTLAYQGLRARIEKLSQSPVKDHHQRDGKQWQGFGFGVFAGLLASVGLAASVGAATGGLRAPVLRAGLRGRSTAVTMSDSNDTKSSLMTRRAIGEAAAMAAGAVAIKPLAASAEGYPRISMQTTQGEMQFELWNDVAPKHVDSFLKLTDKGFYDGLAFHRIIPGFVIQGGDPNTRTGYGPSGTLEGADQSQVSKWGTGGPGYTIPAEFNARLHEEGVLSMARSQDPNSGGSQFFVCLGRLTNLDNKYTVFGKITSGVDVLRKIGAAQTARGDYPQVRQGIEKVTRL